MPSKKFAEALAIIKKITTDQINFQSAMAQMPQLLQAAEDADAVVSNAQSSIETAKAQLLTAETKRDRATREAASAEERSLAAVAESKRLDRELEGKKALVANYGRAEELDSLILTKEKELAGLTSDLDRLRSRHGL